MTLDRTNISIGTTTTKPSVVWENEFTSKINDLLNNVIELDFTKNYLTDFKVVVNDNNLTLSKGVCCDNITFEEIRLDKSLSKFLPNSLDSGSLTPNTFYYVWVIKNVNSNITDLIISTSNTNPLVKIGYSAKKVVGLIKTDSISNFINSYQVDNVLIFKNVLTVSATLLTNTNISVSLNNYAPNNDLIEGVYFTSSLYRSTNATTDALNTVTISSESSETLYSMNVSSINGTTHGDSAMSGLIIPNASNNINYKTDATTITGTINLQLTFYGLQLVL